MVKKESHKNNWLIIAVSVVALVALVLSSVSMTKANITGEAFWDFFRKDKIEKAEAVQEQTQASEVYRGLLAESYLADGKNAESLKGYEVVYDGDGNLVYEIVNNGIRAGENYVSKINEDNNLEISEGENLLESIPGGVYVYHCDCPLGSSCEDLGYCRWEHSGGITYCAGMCLGTEGCSCELSITFHEWKIMQQPVYN